MTTAPSIDTARLEKVRHTANKTTARCPACAAAGNDRTGTHFYLNTATGQFGCAAFPGDSEHRREIYALVGIRQQRDPEADREWKRQRTLEAREKFQRARLAATVRRKARRDRRRLSMDGNRSPPQFARTTPWHTSRSTEIPRRAVSRGCARLDR